MATALLHAARELRRPRLGKAGKADQLDQRFRARPTTDRPADDLERQPDIVDHRPPGEQRRLLEDEADLMLAAGDRRAARRRSVIVPSEGCRMSAIRRRIVDLPQPDGPISAWKPPEGKVSVTSASAVIVFRPIWKRCVT